MNPGTEMWVNSLKWPGLPYFTNSTRKPFKTKSQPDHPAGYVKSYKNFYFYWILDAGHMVNFILSITVISTVSVKFTNTLFYTAGG